MSSHKMRLRLMLHLRTYLNLFVSVGKTYAHGIGPVIGALSCETGYTQQSHLP